MYKTSRKIITLALALILALGICTTPTFAAYTASEWAKPELEKAQGYGLIPDALKDADLTKPITRAEFAAVAVKAYENFTGTSVTPVASNPFTDTSNADVLKAYNINVVNGTSATTYGPNGILTREQAATMLTRVEKKAYIPGWTLATDDSYTLNFTKPVSFTDDNKISNYAKQSVYFMFAKGVINGTGNNMFSPTVTASRQEAIIIAARMVDNLKGKTLDYTQGATQPSGGIDTKLVGSWTWTENPESPVENAGRYIEFKSDGTYYFRYRFHGNYNSSAGTFVNLEGFLTETGKYIISGDTIRCSNVIRSVEITYGDTSANFKNKTYADCDRKFYFEDSPHWLYTELNLIPLRIDMHHPSENQDWVPAEFLSYVNPITHQGSSGIIGWPKELPSVLYPTGLTGTVTTNYGQETISERFAAHQYVRFTVNVNSKDRSVLNPYFEHMRQNGFAFPYGADSVFVKKSMTISGVRYEVTIDRDHLGANPDEVVIHFVFEQYDSPSWDWEWD